MHVSTMHVSTMHVSMTHVPYADTYEACIYMYTYMMHACVMLVKNGDEPTNKAILGVGFGDGKNDDGLTDV